MRLSKSTILCFAIFSSMCIQLAALGTTTAETKAPGAQQANSEAEKDSRLAQKVTYDSGYKRLHCITDDLESMTGMDILCGRNKKDWKVRDIPVVVCVKDLPLGKLLRAIADATHTTLECETIAGSPEKRYRIYRKPADQNSIDTFLQKKHDYSLQLASWQWDALAAYGKSNANPPSDPSLRDAWLVARMIDSLGPDSKSKLLNGDTFTLRGTDPAIGAYVEEYYRRSCQAAYNPSQASTQKLVDAPLNIKLVDDGVDPQIHMLLGPIVTSTATSPNGDTVPATSCCVRGDFPDTDALQDKITGLPPLPTPVSIPSLQDDMNNNEMILLNDHQSDDTKSDSFLMAGIALGKSLSVKDLTFANAIRAIAQTGQCNIVTEDFTSQKAQKYQKINPNLGVSFECSILDALNRLGSSRWFVNEDDKLIVGWQTSPWKTWRDHHASMLPEEYLTEIKTKLNSDGLNLEDVIHLSNLSELSAEDWFIYTDEFPMLYQRNLDPAWRLYDVLSEQDKQLAKSIYGLPLGKFDPAWIVNFFRAEKMQQRPSVKLPAVGSDVEDYRDNTNENNLALTDPTIISTMIMHIQEEPAKRRFGIVGEGTELVDIPMGLNLSSYDMFITYKLNDEQRTIALQSPTFAFPIWSAEREAEILKAASTK